MIQELKWRTDDHNLCSVCFVLARLMPESQTVRMTAWYQQILANALKEELTPAEFAEKYLNDRPALNKWKYQLEYDQRLIFHEYKKCFTRRLEVAND